MSSSVLEKSRKYMPGGVSSPVRSFQNLGCEPLIIDRGHAAHIRSISGKTYLDFCMSWGALIHGHADPVICKRVNEALYKGSSFGLSTPIEAELASRLVSILPHVDKVRFVSSGTEATMSAIRLARGVTGRDRILKFNGHYHGHADACLVNAGSSVFQAEGAPSSPGVTKASVKDSISIPFNDVLALERVFKDPEVGATLAAVILEIVPGNMGVVRPDRDFLKRLEVLARENGTLIIADEVITGFRLHLGGAYQLFDLEPDLVCLGKIIGGGFPCAAFGGKTALMDELAPIGNVFQAGTLSGNPVALTAGLAALDVVSEPGFYTMLNSKVNFIVTALQKVIDEKGLPVRIQSVGGMFTLFFGTTKELKRFAQVKECDFNLFKAYFKHMLSSSIYIAPSPFEALFVSSKHTQEDLEHFVAATLNFFDKISSL